MKSSIKAVLFCTLVLCGLSCESESSLDKSNDTLSKDQVKASDSLTKPDVYLSISIPQNSGLAFVNYTRYEVMNDSLFELDDRFYANFDTLSNGDNYKTDTIAKYALNKSKELKLKTLLSGIDSLGHHTADGCLMQFGYPRFFISTNLDGKEMNGFVANCYRKHIFQLVDFMNECYPKKNVITYKKAELVKRERECNEYNFGNPRK